MINKIQKWLHDKLGWGYPTGILERNPIQDVSGCRFCQGRLTQDSQGNWFHLTY